MADLTEILRGLNTKEAAVSTADLAKDLKASTEGTRKQLTRLKDKGYVDGNSQEGWLITDTGRKALEKGGIHPSMIDEGVTPREKFEAIARRIGIAEERIVLATDIVWSQDYADLKWVWEALGQADIRDDLRKIWVNSWRAFLHKGIPPELEIALTEVLGAGKEAGVKEATGRKAEGRSYILVDDMPTYVGKNLGDLLYQDAVDLARIRAAKVARTSQATSQPMGTDDIIKLVNAVREWGGQTGKKSYIVTQGEQGAVVKEVEAGQPLVLNPPATNAPAPATYLVDGEGKVTQAKPGEPIVITQRPSSTPPAKTFIIRQTPEGMVAEEHDLGKPIIINTAPPSSGPSMPAMLPFPVMGEDGKPVVDQDGKPVYANLEPMMKYMSFQSEQRRADESHGALMGLAKTVRENLGDGIQALKMAAEQAAKGSTGASASASPAQQFECGQCHTTFAIPEGAQFEKVICPNPECRKEYSREEIMEA